MITFDFKSIDTAQKQKLASYYQGKAAQLQFQILKMRRTLVRREALEQKWLSDLFMYRKRLGEGKAACQILTKSNPFYKKIKLDVLKCEIKIMELEIRLERFTTVQKTEKMTKIMALEASISYYQGLITDLETTPNAILSKNISELLVDRPLNGVFDTTIFSNMLASSSDSQVLFPIAKDFQVLIPITKSFSAPLVAYNSYGFKVRRSLGIRIAVLTS